MKRRLEQTEQALSEKKQKLEAELNAINQRLSDCAAEKDSLNDPAVLDEKIKSHETQLEAILSAQNENKKRFKQALSSINSAFERAVVDGQEAQPTCTTESSILLECMITNKKLKQEYQQLSSEYDELLEQRDKLSPNQKVAQTRKTHLFWDQSSSSLSNNSLTSSSPSQEIINP